MFTRFQLCVLLLTVASIISLRPHISSTCNIGSSSQSLTMSSSKCSYNAVMIVPTGIGASIGGFAGDALPSAKLLSTVVDTLITHPNVMNGKLICRSLFLYIQLTEFI